MGAVLIVTFSGRYLEVMSTEAHCLHPLISKPVVNCESFNINIIIGTLNVMPQFRIYINRLSICVVKSLKILESAETVA